MMNPCWRRGRRARFALVGFFGAGFFGPLPDDADWAVRLEYRLSATRGRLPPFPAAMPTARH
jgi:hypothetical protein